MAGNTHIKKKTSNLKSLWLNKYRLGVCGDWFTGDKAEHAWLSANNLLFKIKKNLPR